MLKLEDHPTVKGFQEPGKAALGAPSRLDTDWLRRFCLDVGADDVGFVEMDREDMAIRGRGHPLFFPTSQDPGEFCLPHEPRTYPQPRCFPS